MWKLPDDADMSAFHLQHLFTRYAVASPGGSFASSYWNRLIAFITDGTAFGLLACDNPSNA